MKKKLLFLSFLALAACQGASDSNPASTNNSTPTSASGGSTQSAKTIVGGDDVETGNPLARVVLSHKTILGDVQDDDGTATDQVRIAQCSASALSKTLVLTAAHCVKANTTSVIEFKDADGTLLSIAVVKATVNEDYLKDDTADLAILTLEQPLPDYIQTVSLPDPSMKVDLRTTKITAAGYGRNVDVAPYGGLGVLRTVPLRVSAFDINENTFKVDQSDGKGFCQGDSGGPGLIELEGKMYILGVASKTLFLPAAEGEDQHMCNFRGTYVNILKFKEWIEKTKSVLEKDQSSLSEGGASL